MSDWELTGLTDEEGRLRANLPEQQGIIISPNVKQHGDSIIFAVPNDWTTPISVTDKGIYDFLDAGWQRREDTSGLLEEVLDLANNPRKVLLFAKKWGPLWICCNDYHMEEYGQHWSHYWKPDNFWESGEDFSCEWKNTEKVQDYIRFSKKINAVMNVAAYLQRGESTPDSVWLDFRDSIPKDQKSIMRMFLSELVYSVRLEVTPDLTLRFIAGFGFRTAVYLQLAQVITGTPGLFVCDGCGQRYIRTGRKPAVGRKNFCPKCGEGGRGSKRLWARNK